MAYTFYAGPYSATYKGTSIGTTKEGFSINVTYHQRDIQVDEYGDSIVDMLQAGMDVTVTLDFVEYGRIVAPFTEQQSDAAEGDILTEVGKLLSTKAESLILTPTVRSNNNDTYTFAVAIVVDDISILLSSGLREGPITFRILPETTSTGQHYKKS